ncbi:MAG: dihydroorotate dehydrogenase-like protein [Bacteroidota bacterium]|nr:dihydroorotate dehydrogenase-like protein [Bacteroidota bacterium]
MDLSTTYMGLKLKNPIVPSASPLSRDINTIKALEDAGASAIVLYSLFEEQITHEAMELNYLTTQGNESYAEAVTYFPQANEYHLGPEEYLAHLQKAKQAVNIPVIASLNGVTTGGWLEYAKNIEQAGADGLELNVYYIPTDPKYTGVDIENLYLDILKIVRSEVKIPVAVKLSPFFSSMANIAKKLDDNGANALVLFNRFYQPDIDLETLDVVPNIFLSTPQAMRVPLRWVAILYGKIKADIAATSGIHTSEDVLKMLMVGANVTMMCSALLENGPKHITKVVNDLQRWMEEHEYESVRQMIGSMSHKSVKEPAAFERANYMKVLNSYK